MDVPVHSLYRTARSTETMEPISPPCATYLLKPNPRMSPWIRYETSLIAKSWSSGGGEEYVQPGREGTTKWYLS